MHHGWVRMTSVRVVRRTARGIIIDEDGRLVLFRRTLPKKKPYWSTPGGGVDDEDGSVEAALHREIAEELGAVVDRAQPVFVNTIPRGEGVNIQHFFVCRLVSMDLARRTGSEFNNPAKGRYNVERIDLRGKKLSRYDLQPPAVKAFVLANRQTLLTLALAPDTPPLMISDEDLDEDLGRDLGDRLDPAGAGEPARVADIIEQRQAPRAEPAEPAPPAAPEPAAECAAPEPAEEAAAPEPADEPAEPTPPGLPPGVIDPGPGHEATSAAGRPRRRWFARRRDSRPATRR